MTTIQPTPLRPPATAPGVRLTLSPSSFGDAAVLHFVLLRWFGFPTPSADLVRVSGGAHE